jgi:PAS domain-containing protein
MLDDYFKYQTVIDAMSANIALLDRLGVIKLVNRNWRSFSDANGGKPGEYGLGFNYLDLGEVSPCESTGHCRANADLNEERRNLEAATAGIRAVLVGETDRFEMSYPCHSPTEERWFLLTVTPFPNGSTLKVVVSHENITQLVRAEKQALLQSKRLISTFKDTVEAISLAIEMKDPYTAGHQRQVVSLAVRIGEALQLDEDELFGLALGASIHDIGKISAPGEILNRPGKLTVPEFMIIQAHAEAGHDILKNIAFPWPISDMVWQHHERWDGTGYPQKLKGHDICLGARIIAVADTFDAITSHRPYRPGRSAGVAIQELRLGRGTAFDPDIIDVAIPLLEAMTPQAA